MHDHKHCPECESLDTAVQHTEFFSDMVERVRTCEDCPTQWTVSYADPIVKEVQNFD
jgi:transcriptional regulator NrdR family protein